MSLLRHDLVVLLQGDVFTDIDRVLEHVTAAGRSNIARLQSTTTADPAQAIDHQGRDGRFDLLPAAELRRTGDGAGWFLLHPIDHWSIHRNRSWREVFARIGRLLPLGSRQRQDALLLDGALKYLGSLAEGNIAVLVTIIRAMNDVGSADLTSRMGRLYNQVASLWIRLSAGHCRSWR